MPTCLVKYIFISLYFDKKLVKRKMIGEEDFKSQVYDIYKSGNLQNISNCKCVEFIDKGNKNKNEGLSQVLKCQFIISSEIDTNSSHTFTTQKHSGKDSRDKKIIVEILVCYEAIFQEPQLCFRLWDQVEENYDSVRLNYDSIDGLKKNSRLPSWFVLNIDLIDNEPWFIVGVCDTENIIGNQLLDYKNCYMKRWISVYLISWLT